ncbi:cupin domain-containing protein [Halococcus agarilyticus]|uniref:cupin domain-containing protein n=1 Tax=Halococcus agarilyticus TaxID=1232219 RepID=UPI00067771ED|nr:cupin domain-containing protein [Halococcus agarilyticus]
MEKVSIDDVDPVIQPAAIMRPLTEALGTTDVAINYYELEPGDSFAYGYHVHEIQEEVFCVLSGTATFETETGSVPVAAGEVVRFPPGEYQRGVNEGDERVTALALGAPLEYGEQTMLRECATCGERTSHRITSAADGDARVTLCDLCGTETGRWTL